MCIGCWQDVLLHLLLFKVKMIVNYNFLLSSFVIVFVRPKLRRVEIDNPQTKKLYRKPSASIQS